MRFKGEMVAAIKRGEKDVTRRLIREDGILCRYKAGKVYQATNRPRFEQAGMKSNSEKGWETFPIRIVSVRQELIGDITESEAIREGFRPFVIEDHALTARDQFLIMWGAINGPPNGNPRVWRIEFTLAPRSWK